MGHTHAAGDGADVQRQTIVDMANVISDLNQMLLDYVAETNALRVRVASLENHILILEAENDKEEEQATQEETE